MTTDSLPASRRDDLPGVARLLTLSDNVVAIALTLLVLQFRPIPPGPPGEAWVMGERLHRHWLARHVHGTAPRRVLRVCRSTRRG